MKYSSNFIHGNIKSDKLGWDKTYSETSFVKMLIYFDVFDNQEDIAICSIFQLLGNKTNQDGTTPSPPSQRTYFMWKQEQK